MSHLDATLTSSVGPECECVAVHGAGIACMKEETKRIKRKERKIQKKKKIPLGGLWVMIAMPF